MVALGRHLRATLSHPDASTLPSPVPEAAPGCVGDMADTPRDAMLKQTAMARNEKAPVDFGYVGIDSILEQMRRKAMKQGFEFNIMVVGECPRRLPPQPRPRLCRSSLAAPRPVTSAWSPASPLQSRQPWPAGSGAGGLGASKTSSHIVLGVTL